MVNTMPSRVESTQNESRSLMTLTLVPFAVIVATRTHACAIGLPLAWMFPRLCAWLEDGTEDL